MLTIGILHSLFPSTRVEILSQYVQPLNEELPYIECTTKSRIAGFLAQTGFESEYYMRLEENLNYSAEGLLKTFPNRFDSKTAAQYAHNPIAIANRAYADKNGNGNEASGDGWKWHGRGLIQLTGRNNYVACASAMHMSPDSLIPVALTPAGAVNTAAWYWNSNKLNDFCDREDFTGLTKHINAMMYGYTARKALYDKAKTLL